MRTVMQALRHGRGVAWDSLIPAFDTAIQQAREAEYLSAHYSPMYGTDISPNYPPLVLDLARAGGWTEAADRSEQ